MQAANVSGPMTRMTVCMDLYGQQRLSRVPGILSAFCGFRPAAEYAVSYLKHGFSPVNFALKESAGIDLEVHKDDHVLIPGSGMMSKVLLNAGATGGTIELLTEPSALDPKMAADEILARFNTLISSARENLIRCCLRNTNFTLRAAGPVPGDISAILQGELKGAETALPFGLLADNAFTFHRSVEDISSDTGTMIANHAGVSSSTLVDLMRHRYFFAGGFPQYRAAYLHEGTGYTLAFIGSGPDEGEQERLLSSGDTRIIYPVREAASKALAAMARSDRTGCHLLRAAHGMPKTVLLSPLSGIKIFSDMSEVPDISQWEIAY